MSDPFASHAASLTAPAADGFQITPTDGSDLSQTTRAIYVGGPGNLSLVLHSGASITLTGVPAGSLLPLRIKKVAATGTTATALVGLL